MSQKVFNCIAGILFSIIAVLHALRLVFGWEAVIAGWSVPHWVSGPALLFFGFLAFAAFRLARRP